MSQRVSSERAFNQNYQASRARENLFQSQRLWNAQVAAQRAWSHQQQARAAQHNKEWSDRLHSMSFTPLSYHQHSPGYSPGVFDPNFSVLDEILNMLIGFGVGGGTVIGVSTLATQGYVSVIAWAAKSPWIRKSGMHMLRIYLRISVAFYLIGLIGLISKKSLQKLTESPRQKES